MPSKHGPDANSRSGSVQNARCGCTSAGCFPKLSSNMLAHIHSEADLDAALAALGEADPRFVALVAEAGRPPLRRRQGGFAGLAAAVVSQQLSTASAAAIWGRLAAAFDPFDPEAIIGARGPKLAR